MKYVATTATAKSDEINYIDMTVLHKMIYLYAWLTLDVSTEISDFFLAMDVSTEKTYNNFMIKYMHCTSTKLSFRCYQQLPWFINILELAHLTSTNDYGNGLLIK